MIRILSMFLFFLYLFASPFLAYEYLGNNIGSCVLFLNIIIFALIAAFPVQDDNLGV